MKIRIVKTGEILDVCTETAQVLVAAGVAAVESETAVDDTRETR